MRVTWRNVARFAVGVSVLWTAGWCAASPAGGPSGSTRVPVEHIGVVAAERDARLAFTVSGQVKAVRVKPGDRVEAGAALVELDDTVGLAQAEVYRLRAESTLAVDAAEKQWKLAQVEEGLVKEAMEKGSAGQFEVDRATLKAQLSWLEFQKARQDRREAELSMKQAEALHALRTLRAPMAGVVEEVIVQEGESAETGRPVVRVVSTERFRVEVNPPTADAARLQVGGGAVVRFEAAPGAAPVDARATISHIASVADARSQTRLVHLTMPNPGGLPAGVQVRVMFDEPGAPDTPRAP